MVKVPAVKQGVGRILVPSSRTMSFQSEDLKSIPCRGLLSVILLIESWDYSTSMASGGGGLLLHKVYHMCECM